MVLGPSTSKEESQIQTFYRVLCVGNTPRLRMVEQRPKREADSKGDTDKETRPCVWAASPSLYCIRLCFVSPSEFSKNSCKGNLPPTHHAKGEGRASVSPLRRLGQSPRLKFRTSWLRPLYGPSLSQTLLPRWAQAWWGYQDDGQRKGKRLGRIGKQSLSYFKAAPN